MELTLNRHQVVCPVVAVVASSLRHRRTRRTRETLDGEQVTMMRSTIELATVLLVGAVVSFTACGEDKTAAQKPEPIEQGEVALPPFELESELPPSVREAVLKPFTGDLDELVKRRAVRIGVTYNRTFYYVD